ncbi:hypothetical protein [Streptomyces sp. cmx-10-25]|uniref:hypothetical protein n=1 Tax=Streptomyces sp. cmx-10-25 TaxID=2790919 RepID=UPI00397F63CE
MSPMERLMQEAVPVRPERADGTLGLWTQQDQDRHWNDLCEAMRVPGQQRPTQDQRDHAA